MKRYLNVITVEGIKTVDELSISDYATPCEFISRLNHLVSIYRSSGINIFISSLSDKNFNN